MSEHIVKAAKLIWYDNGMINQFESEEEKILQLTSWLKTTNKDLVSLVDKELSKLSQCELYEVCCGCQDEDKFLLSDISSDFLNRIFNEEYSCKDIEGLYQLLAHGSEDHRLWLKKALSHYFNGTEKPEYQN